MKRDQWIMRNLLAALILLSCPSVWAAKVTSIDFKSSIDASQIEIRGDQALQYETQENSPDHQVVIDLKDAKLSPQAKRRLDTSSFRSNVSLISPYQVAGGNARVVIQMRKSATPAVTQDGNVLKISIPMGAAPGDAPADAATAPQAAADGTPPPPAGDGANGAPTADGTAPPAADTAANGVATPGVDGTPPPPAGDATAAATGGPTPDPNAPPAPTPTDADSLAGLPGSDTAGAPPAASADVGNNSAKGKAADKLGPKGAIDEFAESRVTKNYVGKPISLSLREADILEAFQLIGEASGFNVIVGDDVKGKITISLTDVPWDQALDLILTTRQLGAERNQNVLRIVTLQALTQEKQAELAAKKASEANAPRVTRVFPISYAKLAELTTVFQKFGSTTGDAAATQVQADDRTNSIIVRDTAENIERIKRLIELLDTQTPQVLIEARIVEASENFARGIGGSLGIGRNTAPPAAAGSSSTTTGSVTSQGTNFGAGFNNATPYTDLVTSLSTNVGGATAGASSFAFAPVLSWLTGDNQTRLNALLNFNESENHVKIVGSPRLVVLNKESASILSSSPIVVKTSQVIQGIPTPVETILSANLSLDVKPTVTNDGGVLMDLKLQKDQPIQDTGIANRNLTTKVLVESGTTLVIGGIYTQQTTESEQGFPFLRKIPIIGWLFGNENKTTDRSEIFIFITPRILNEKEAGLTG